MWNEVAKKGMSIREEVQLGNSWGDHQILELLDLIADAAGESEGIQHDPHFDKVKVRISDNVLDDEDWTVYELEFAVVKGRSSTGAPITRTMVVNQRLVNQGVYGDDIVGRDLERLALWLSYDSTGSHPEQYHEIWDPGTNSWESVDLEKLTRMVGSKL